MTEIILGPPGTGKTTTLLNIVDEEMARGTPPDRIAFVSFTRRAAKEAQTRACEKFRISSSDLPWFRTIHSLCFRWLGLRSSEVLNEWRNLRTFAEWAGVVLTGRWAEDGSMQGYSQGDRVIHMIHVARARRLPLRQVYDEDDDDLPWSEVERVDRFLATYKMRTGLIDYAGMLEEFIRLGTHPRLDVLLVDEYQDLSCAQQAVVDVLSRDCRRVVVAGDDDQGIYRWAGADSESLVQMSGVVRVLGQSYRVPRVVQSLAQRIVEQIRERRPKAWAARDDEGVVERAEDIGAVDVGEGEVLMLARNSFILTEQIVPEMQRAGVHYAWGEHSAVSAETLRAIQIWEKLRSGGEVTVEDAVHVYGYMSAGQGYIRGMRNIQSFINNDEWVNIIMLKDRAGLLRDSIWHEALDRLPGGEVSHILAARRRGERLLGPPRVRLSTIHSAKGGEADHVVLMTEMARRTAREAERLPDDEARVFYVAVTRARRRLTIVNYSSKWGYEL